MSDSEHASRNHDADLRRRAEERLRTSEGHPAHADAFDHRLPGSGEMDSRTHGADAGQWLIGEGEMVERIRAFDWGNTPLGPPEAWPQNLKAAVTLCLSSRFPIVIWWDREQAVQFYNDPYISFLGPTKHPAFLGRSGRECWGEIWETMGPLWDKVFGAGEANRLRSTVPPRHCLMKPADRAARSVRSSTSRR